MNEPELNSLGMSDDDFENLSFDEWKSQAEDAPADTEEPEPEDQDVPEEPEVTDEPDTDGADEEAAASGVGAGDVVDPQPETPDLIPPADQTQPAGEVDYKAAYEKIMAPFRANNREMRVSNVDEALQLMQMGANYNKKMSAIKPYLRAIKTLERHQLLDENKLAFLVDLHNRDKGAIEKLLKDGEISPMDLDPDAAEYTPKTRPVSDREVELENVLNDLEGSQYYAKTLSLVSKEWDQKSREIIVENPQLLNTIHDHIAAGIFDRVVSEMERQRMFGRLQGMSDIEAYKATGDYLHSQGAFNQPGKSTPAANSPRNAKAAEDIRKQRRAVAPTRQNPGPASAPVKNVLDLSDEEFERLNPKFV